MFIVGNSKTKGETTDGQITQSLS